MEEEFLVVDPVTRRVVPHAAPVVARAAARLGSRVSGEITKLHVETRTDPVSSAGTLREQLTEARRVVVESAAAEGLWVVAAGTPVLPGPSVPPVTEGPRQDRGTATFRGLHDELAICALHVHVELPDRERALRVSNHLRAYLPLLLVLTANSPYWDGRDSGYASWRTMIWPRWPVAGPPPRFTSLAHYEQVVGMLLTAGATVDTGTLFWDVRPSVTHPTLEVRVADVPVTAQESVLYAVLVRALVVTASEAVDRGDDGPDIPAEVLRAAYWRAARDGLAGELLDVRPGRLVPARELLAELVRTVRPALRAHGDEELV
ncbi:carboxylate-amine ligase, partial [Micromonospora echinofusca]|uniref:carboxylate-amine ligase n=1 Tax=Micromonospora echinofusca TaxID=47858 RepID=UPI0027DCD17C